MANYSVPNTVTYSGEELARIKNESLVPGEELEILRKKADGYLSMPTLATVYKKLIPPSGDPHDYMSMGPYWWPNPDTPDGLPYVRRDGLRNPETKEPNNYGEVASRVHTLALAAYHFDEPAYAKKACDLIYDWHVNPETKMNPHANYGQSIPGICTGRGIGLIEFAGSSSMFNGIEILKAMGEISDSLLAEVKEWYNSFINWMITSEIGLAEDVYFNNHGSWYDVQVLAAATFLERPTLAKRVYTLAYGRRHKTQVEKNGAQPHELARTKGLCYSMYNLNALISIAIMAKKHGFDKYLEPDEDYGVVLIREALDYIYPFAMQPETFPYQELTPAHAKESIVPILHTMDTLFPGEGYKEKAEALTTPEMLLHIRPFA